MSPMQQGIRVTCGVELTERDAPSNFAQIDAVEGLARGVVEFGDAVGETWRGARPTLPDSLPMIGPAPRHSRLWLAFGNQHIGFTTGPATGEAIAAMIAGAPPPFDVAAFAPTPLHLIAFRGHRNVGSAPALTPKKEFPMHLSRLLIVTGLLVPLHAFAQSSPGGGSTGGAASGTTGIGGGGTARTNPGVVSDSFNSPAAQSTAPNPGAAGNPSSAASNPSTPNAPGTNSAGTAQSSGSMTTGSAVGSTKEDEKFRAEDPKLDKKIKSICRGC